MKTTLDRRGGPSPLFWLLPVAGLIGLTALIGALVSDGPGTASTVRDQETAADQPAQVSSTDATAPTADSPDAPVSSDDGAATGDPKASAAVSSDDDSGKEAPPASISSGSTCLGIPAPNTFMTFEGERHELVEVFCAEGVDDSGFVEVGVTSEIDLPHQGPVTVYRGPDGSLLTLEDGEQKMWSRWLPEDETGVAPDGSGEPVDDGLNYSAQATCTADPAPNVFMTFEGKQWALAEVFCKDGLPESAVERVGATEEIMVAHQGPVDVFRDDRGSTFTLKPADPNGEPAMWYRWVEVR